MEKFFIQIKGIVSSLESSNVYFSFRTVILVEGNTHKLKIKDINLKDAGEISFQCADVKDSCKISVKECMYQYLFFSIFD
jgi:hypothetical protein